MQMQFAGTPTDECPAILSTGQTDARMVFLSLSKREPAGKDVEYLTWHTMDHRPEQFRIAGLRNAMRVVSTPECRAARAISEPQFDAVDHVVAYLFTGPESAPAFHDLFVALCDNGRFEPKLPPVGFVVGDCSGRKAAPRVVVGADVLPWRPMTGAYVIIEEGAASAAPLIDLPGVAGVWWFDGMDFPAPFEGSVRGKQITICYLDGDPLETAQAMKPVLARRWAEGEVKGLLAAPFHTVVPFEWSRFLP